MVIKTQLSKLLSILGLIIITVCLSAETDMPGTNKPDRTAFDYVNPFIGTNQMGHTYPGATVPYGMIQLSPDTENAKFYRKGLYNKDVYKYCAGYQYQDTTIVGFSHTHFNGTGHSDLGDFLVMPVVGELQLDPGTVAEPDKGYRSRFSHCSEYAEPGYYRVKLEDYSILAELTASTRVGFHRYTFPESDKSRIILDMIHSIYGYDGKIIWSTVRIENNTTVTGFRHTSGWARSRYLYFALVFSKPFKSYGYLNLEPLPYRGFWDRALKPKPELPQLAGKKLRVYFNFDTKKGEVIKLKLAISPVSASGALKNLTTEIPKWEFDRVRLAAKGLWNRELDKITIEADKRKMEIFYTSLYHTMLGPIVYMDVDNNYRGLDNNIHSATDFTNYTLFSLWDTYRALHPLLTIVQPDRVSDMINSMLAHYEQSVFKVLPVWSFHANETWCMTGYHSVSVIADAYLKGIRNYDTEKALRAVVGSASHSKYSGLGNYLKYGYIPHDLEFGANSASKTLEYAYDDWAVFKMAESMGQMKTAADFARRAAFYRNLFDKQTSFIRARKSDGSWLTPFDPLKTTGQGYIEGNAWNYSLHIPHDINGYMQLIGGRKNLITMLDGIFNLKTPKEAYQESEDIESSGILGGYIHGNEPSHHIPYLYNWAGAPWKTQSIIHEIVNEMYTTKTNGIPGNDDTGQMSAWYIFSTMGFYPVCPGSNQYVIGSPCLDKVEIKLGNNKFFKIIAQNLSEKNIYIQSAMLNGKKLKNSYITHQEIMHGGELIFKMAEKPNKIWASNPDNIPYSMSK